MFDAVVTFQSRAPASTTVAANETREASVSKGKDWMISATDPLKSSNLRVRVKSVHFPAELSYILRPAAKRIVKS